MVDDQEILFCEPCLRTEQPNLQEDPNASTPIFEQINDFTRTTEGIKLFHQNINGIVRKRESIRILLKETRGKIDILGLSEIKILLIMKL